MQVGSLLPVLRPHCSNMVIRYREPWNYDEETEDICRNYFSLRYRLLEKIYKDAHKSYEDGSPLVKSLSWDYPKDKNCTKYFGEYFFADILVGYLDYASANFCQKSLLSGKDYVGKIKCRYYLGTNLEGEPILEKEYTISGKKITVIQDMAENKDKYKKVYIMLGLNEINWPNYTMMAFEFISTIN